MYYISANGFGIYFANREDVPEGLEPIECELFSQEPEYLIDEWAEQNHSDDLDQNSVQEQLINQLLDSIIQ